MAMMIYGKEALDVLQTKVVMVSVDALLRAIKVPSPMKLADFVFEKPESLSAVIARHEMSDRLYQNPHLARGVRLGLLGCRAVHDEVRC
jgi:hypothetical protein